MASSKNPKIGIVGAGIAGLCTAVQLQLQLGIHDYTLFEENDEVGGAWYKNTYPGCACDVPTYFYSFSFEENPNWSQLYCPQSEILAYLKFVARKYNVYKNIKFKHQVLKAIWNNKTSNWRILSRNEQGEEEEHVFDVIFLSVGGLRVPNIPEFSGPFTGPKMHSAQWDSSVSLEGQNVAIVGTGASAVQIIPNIVDKVKTLHVYQRNPPWVLPQFQFNIPLWLQWGFSYIPLLQKTARYIIMFILQVLHQAFKKNSIIGKTLETVGRLYLWKEFNKEGQPCSSELIPKYHIGGKRFTPSSKYYKALSKPNVRIHTKRIVEVKGNSILTQDDNIEEIDVLILATGFRVTDYSAPLQVIGKNGMDMKHLSDTEGISIYLGIVNSQCPNCFMIFGPNGSPATTSFVYSVECGVQWAIQFLKEMRRKGSRVMTVKVEEERNYMTKIHSKMESMVWSYDYPSWYRDKGVVVAISPYSGLEHWKNTRVPNFKHFNLYPNK